MTDPPGTPGNSDYSRENEMRMASNSTQSVITLIMDTEGNSLKKY